MPLRALLAVVGLAAPLAASLQGTAQEPAEEQRAGWRFAFAPAEVLYPAYVADPRRPTFSLAWVNTRESDIDEASDRRYALRLGTRFALLELAGEDEDGAALQLAGEVGMLAQFDRENASDNLGWDGLYGFHLAWRARPELVLRAGLAHDSSHIGDELIEDTGRARIEYTREEWLAGVSWAPLAGARGYLEYGHAYDLRNEDLMERGRAQLGLVLEPAAGTRRVAPFAALDLSAFEEDDWEENLCVQLGVVRPGAGRGAPWRAGVEYYDGRATIGEFFQDRERHLALGLWLDL